MATDKDTIYIDIDDEITGIIDKLKASNGKVVALVLPKRAAVFQSIVNMKLLKRAADASKKNAVLITSEAGLLPLAGAAGLHVAKTLSSKPEIPVAPSMADESEETAVDESEADGAEPSIDSSQSVGALSGAASAPPPPPDNGVETIALDDEIPPPEDVSKRPEPKTFEPPKAKKNKKLKVPNFDRFRLWLILGVLLLIVLIGGFIFANSSLAKATIDIKTDATNINVNQDLSLSTAAKTASSDGSAVPAKLEQLQKTYSQQVPTTGQKNNGNKATGAITLTTGCLNTQPDELPAGSGVSANGQTYITQSSTDFANNPQKCGGGLFNPYYKFTSSVDIAAQSGGTSYNTPNGTSFTVAGRSDLSASGSASGGTDNIVQSVNQNDINNAKSKISASDSGAKSNLNSQTRGDGYYPLSATFNTGTPNVTTSANVGDEASTVTVTEVITYTMFGVHQSDLNNILDSNIRSQIDTSKQSILDNGLSSANYIVGNQDSNGATLTLTTKAVVGPQLSESSIKADAAGKKAGEIKSQLASNPDVTSVSVKFSPFWVSSAPKNPDRITINIAKPTTTKGR